jgi:flavodoxin I
MNILLIFATYSGGTQTAAQTITDNLQKQNHSVNCQKHFRKPPQKTWIAHDAIILCSPTWDFDGKEGMPHEDFVHFMENNKEKSWEGKPFAVMCLGDSSYTHFCGSVDHLEAFIRNAKGNLAIAFA